MQGQIVLEGPVAQAVADLLPTIVDGEQIVVTQQGDGVIVASTLSTSYIDAEGEVEES